VAFYINSLIIGTSWIPSRRASKTKSELVDLGKEITEEARLLDGTSHETLDAVKDEEEEEEEENSKELSDSGSDKGPKDKKVYKKTKGKSKAHVKRSKMVDSELDAEWDYKLDLMRGSAKKGRRASDASEKEVPLRAKAGLTTSH